MTRWKAVKHPRPGRGGRNRGDGMRDGKRLGDNTHSEMRTPGFGSSRAERGLGRARKTLPGNPNPLPRPGLAAIPLASTFSQHVAFLDVINGVERSLPVPIF